jgi:hypothetical protein
MQGSYEIKSYSLIWDDDEEYASIFHY